MLDALRKLITDFGDEGHHPSRFQGDDYRLAACALLASIIPARRAATVNPVNALRVE